MSATAQPSASPTSTDRIEKTFTVNAPRSRVWRALADEKEFGTWFRMKFDRPLAEGATVRGQLTHPGYEHVTVDLLIERIMPESYFSYRWHPGAVDPKVDYSKEPTTLVEFTLKEVKDGTEVTIVESGFDRIPAGRRVEAFRMNEKGWEGQARNLAKHVSAA